MKFMLLAFDQLSDAQLEQIDNICKETGAIGEMVIADELGQISEENAKEIVSIGIAVIQGTIKRLSIK
jgi:hypothetical protein